MISLLKLSKSRKKKRYEIPNKTQKFKPHNSKKKIEKKKEKVHNVNLVENQTKIFSYKFRSIFVATNVRKLN